MDKVEKDAQIKLIKVIMEQGRKMDQDIANRAAINGKLVTADFNTQYELGMLTDVLRRECTKLINSIDMPNMELLSLFESVKTFHIDIGYMQDDEPKGLRRRAGKNQRNRNIPDELLTLAEMLGLDIDNIQMMKI